MSIARWLHLLGVVVWVGGMFFAHMALRPSVQALPPPQRLPLLAATLSRFLDWVGVAVLVILASGTAMIVLMGGFRAVNGSVHAMTALGIVMMLIYGHIKFGHLRRLSAAVAAGEWEVGGAAMGQVRKLIAVNLVLGLVTLTIAVLGRG